ncbi:hypothetical protein GCM10007053_02560 [Halioglobus pacificus]|uniref:Uncharacterized protein n=2 Tax=Parahalioglobus pacificus TaxID=930806 RepID=A0A918XCN6_9GAMM|nr:hypothetical protein GCM10007053_02560 [Halioglobus pacificus]
MLYYIDSTLYPTLGTTERWLESILVTLEDPSTNLSPTERNAVALLFECSGSGECAMSQDSLLSLIRLVVSRKDVGVDIAVLLKVYSSAGGDRNLIMKALGEAMPVGEASFGSVNSTAEAIRDRDFALMYVRLLNWVRADVGSRDIYLQSKIFEN